MIRSKGESVTDISNIISQLEQQKASIDRAIEALREITDLRAAPAKPVRSASSSDAGLKDIALRQQAGRQRLAEAMKRRWAAKRAAVKNANKSANGNGPTSAKTSTATKGRSMTAEQKRAISKAWTPERKQKFAEFHVQRMARERGEDPAKALREYRRRKQREQAGASAARKTSAQTVPRKGAVKKSAAKVATATAAAS